MEKLIAIVFVLGSTYLGANLLAPATSGPASKGNAAFAMTQDQDQDEQETAKAQMRQQFMRGKLESNKKIVEGLTTNDFKMIAAGADEVTAYVKGQHWFVLQTDEYKDYSRNMEAISKKLAGTAKDRNIEAAALRYLELTVNCIDCHQYIASTEY